MTLDEAKQVTDADILAEIRRERMLKAFGVWTRPPYTGNPAGQIADRIVAETHVKESSAVFRYMMNRVQEVMDEERRACASSDS